MVVPAWVAQWAAQAHRKRRVAGSSPAPSSPSAVARDKRLDRAPFSGSTATAVLLVRPGRLLDAAAPVSTGDVKVRIADSILGGHEAGMAFFADFGLIARCLLAVLWGVGLAAFLQFSRWGQYLVVERTWITVVAGVGVDMALAIGGDWATCALVFACSSVGIIGRSWFNESRHMPDMAAYRTKWAMEDVIDLSGDMIGGLETALRAEALATCQAEVSESLATAHRVQRIMTTTRYGDPEPPARRRGNGR